MAVSTSGVPETPKASDARQALRAALLDAKNSIPVRKPLELFGMKVELLQPSLRDIMQAKSKTPEQAQVSFIINYLVVPGTNERIFTDEDANYLLSWPFGPDLARFAQAINELTGVDIESTKEELKQDPLAAASSSSAKS